MAVSAIHGLLVVAPDFNEQFLCIFFAMASAVEAHKLEGDFDLGLVDVLLKT